MTMQLNAYVNFRNKARQAMEFYHGIFGGKLTVNTFAEFHASDDPAEQDLVMHAQLETDAGFVLMGSDAPARIAMTEGTNFSLSISGDDEPTLRGYFDALSDGGTVTMALAQAPWGGTFGMCTDRFGVQWMVNIAA